jgi:hypothetical protein
VDELRNKDGRKPKLPRPELGLFAATRAMLGAGVGLIVADKLGEDERKVIGWTLFLMGVVSTVPLVRDIFSKLR